MAKHHRNGRGQAAWGARRSRALHGEGPAVLQRAQQLWIAAGAVVLLASLFVLDATRPASALTSSVELDRPLVMRGSGEPVYVLIKLDAPDASGERAERPPLNVALVLDRSGSMEDAGKIDYLRTASAMVVDQLEPSDRLAVVEYDDEITVLWPSGPVEAKGTVKRLIQGLTPRGSTNLTGGMMEGVAQAETTLERATPRQGTITRVLLLSDGLANQGITDPAEIRRLVRTARLDGVRISALGLGRDYDEDLMQAIAENGGGKYHYIEHPNQMARIFEEELNTLFATVVRDARFAFKPGSGVAATQLLTFEDATKEGAVALDMGEFYAKESRTYVLKLDMSG
ncbi:MAG: VWA domain-containing protein, partial [Pseudomonadota bacterium]